MLPTFATVRASGEAVNLSNGMNVVLQYGDLVYKEIPTPRSKIQKAAKQLKKAVGGQLRSRIHLLSYLDHHGPIDPDLELEITQHWANHGIPTVELAEEQPDAHIYKLIDGKPFNQVLEGPGYQREAFAALLSTINAMRNAAYCKRDRRLLHSDMHTKNFLWAEDEKTAVAIDPHPRPLNGSVPLETIDALLNLQFMYSILLTSPTQGTRYAENFAGSLGKEHHERMLANNLPVPAHITGIYHLYEEVASRIWPEKQCNLSLMYSREKRLRIDDILRSS